MRFLHITCLRKQNYMDFLDYQRVSLSLQKLSHTERSRLRGIIKKIGYDYNIKIVEIEIPVDPIHMVVRSEPKIAPSDIMQIIKSISAREFFRRFLQIKAKYFWGGKLLTQSYFAETVGNVSEETIREYV